MKQWMLTIFFFVITLSNVQARLTNHENERALADFHKIIWQLETSTHSGLNELSGTDIPEISFNEEREYKIKWNCTDDNLFGCNRYAGYWGLGENNRLTFYRRSTQISGAFHASTIAQLEKADAFAIVDNKLILKENEDTWHRFV